MRTAAKIISIIFHPLLFPSYLVVVLGFFMPHFLLIPQQALLSFLGLVFVMTFVLPSVNLLMFRVFGTMQSLQMESRKERLLPFVLISIIYSVVSFMFFYKVSINVNFNKVMLIVALMVVMATVATFFMKVSVHSLSVCGAIGITLPLNKAVGDGSMLWPTIGIMLVAGIVMSSRLLLNKHTPREVLYGAVLGFSSGFFGMTILF